MSKKWDLGAGKSYTTKMLMVITDKEIRSEPFYRDLCDSCLYQTDESLNLIVQYTWRNDIVESQNNDRFGVRYISKVQRIEP